MRPRNLLKIFNICKGFAISFNRTMIGVEDIEKGLRAYSEDLHEELERELQDVFPDAQDLLYHFLDAPAVMTQSELFEILLEAGIDIEEWQNVINFMLYYGIVGIRTKTGDFYIYDVNYDRNMIDIRIARERDALLYIVHPAFWPGLAITPPDMKLIDHRA